MVEQTFEKAEIEFLQNKDIKYQEIFTTSFKEAVDDMENNKDSSESSFCLVDIDGCLIEDNLVKLPFFTHLVEPEINTEVEESFNRLIDIFDDSLVIASNRSLKESKIFNSQKVLEVVKDLIKSTGKNIPIFTSLYKQAPTLFRENIRREYLSDETRREFRGFPVCSPRLNPLIHYIGKRITEEDYEKLVIYSIEDWSIVSLNRKTSLKYITESLKKEYDIDVRVINYVVKR
jgi:hypothetical protein